MEVYSKNGIVGRTLYRWIISNYGDKPKLQIYFGFEFRGFYKAPNSNLNPKYVM